MANIITKTFSDGPNQGIRLGVDYTTSSYDTYMSRELAFSSSWNVLRMGISFGVADNSYSSYDRMMGLSIGMSSGSYGNVCSSTSSADGVSGLDVTFLGMFFGGNMQRITSNTTNPYTFEFNNTGSVVGATNLSGSYFTNTSIYFGGKITGSLTPGSSGLVGVTRPLFIFSNINDPTYTNKRSMLMLEISFSTAAANAFTKMYGVTSSISHRDYTSGDLLSIMTGSIVGSHAIPLGRYAPVAVTHNRTGFPLDTAFIEWFGGTPIEIYDWYIVKIA